MAANESRFASVPLDGMDYDTGRAIGPQEHVTISLVESYEKAHPLDVILHALCQSMMSLARNIDIQNEKGKEISRNMTVYLDGLQKIDERYPKTQDDDGELHDFLTAFKASK